MLASLEWLKQYVDINISTEELCDKITRVGLEVDTVTKLGQGLEGVVTGKVMEISRHPNSDHLWVCMMDYGQGGEPVQILTGAQNLCHICIRTENPFQIWMTFYYLTHHVFEFFVSIFKGNGI